MTMPHQDSEPMLGHIRNSNLIEGIDDSLQDARSLDAWEYIQKMKRLSMTSVLELHKGITIDQLLPKECGKLRKVNVSVGGRTCPEPFLAQEILYNWILDMRYWQNLGPKEMHVRFEKIHPFVDGNGRTGRMLMWWHEQKLGREPTLIKFEERQKYYEWFK